MGNHAQKIIQFTAIWRPAFKEKVLSGEKTSSKAISSNWNQICKVLQCYTNHAPWKQNVETVGERQGQSHARGRSIFDAYSVFWKYVWCVLYFFIWLCCQVELGNFRHSQHTKTSLGMPCVFAWACMQAWAWSVILPKPSEGVNARGPEGIEHKKAIFSQYVILHAPKILSPKWGHSIPMQSPFCFQLIWNIWVAWFPFFQDSSAVIASRKPCLRNKKVCGRVCRKGVHQGLVNSPLSWDS